MKTEPDKSIPSTIWGPVKQEPGGPFPWRVPALLCVPIWGPVKQEPGGQPYRVGSSTGVALPTQPDAQPTYDEATIKARDLVGAQPTPRTTAKIMECCMVPDDVAFVKMTALSVELERALAQKEAELRAADARYEALLAKVVGLEAGAAADMLRLATVEAALKLARKELVNVSGYVEHGAVIKQIDVALVARKEGKS